MKRLFEVNPWSIIENELHLDDFRLAESMVSLSNGHMGIRGNFEESFTGDSHKGTYIAGIYYPDKTRVGWWKNGYPDYFAKVLNAPDFLGIRVIINNEEIDLAKVKVLDYKRELHMKHGYVTRSFIVQDKQNNQTKIEAKRFLSIVDKEIGAISYSVTPINHNGTITFIPFLNGEIRNEDANYEEDFWVSLTSQCTEGKAALVMRTKKTKFDVAVAMEVSIEGADLYCEKLEKQDEFVSNNWSGSVKEGQTVTIYKYLGVTTSRDYLREEVLLQASKKALLAKNSGFNTLLNEHSEAWKKRWEDADIVIEGDDAAQQAIRFNIFQLFSTYFGEDARLNIGPKGFTGEKYGGSTYWDTEAYCFPMYLATTDELVSRNLLLYRYHQLPQAKENAKKLGLNGALYPMVTMDGHESHNEWEITFEEIHRNGAIAYAIYNYTNYTGDIEYEIDYGLEVLIEISRFWASRVHYQPKKKVYMLHGVTGPSEYDNNVNNNWYTNRIAAWTLEYTLQVYERVKKENEEMLAQLEKKVGLQQSELDKFQEISNQMYYPFDEELQIFEQHDGYLDKELIPVSVLSKEDLPLNQNWSWDRILRSCFIKQADVLQGLYFLGNDYDVDVKKRHFDFYEPMTVHESSLSPSIYSIIASEIGYEKKAYELYLRTARLDLDNYNNDTEDGLHITSMSGAWLSIVQGFAGMKTWDEQLSFSPFIPDNWHSYSFKIIYRGRHLQIKVTHNSVEIKNRNGNPLLLKLYNQNIELKDVIKINIEK